MLGGDTRLQVVAGVPRGGQLIPKPSPRGFEPPAKKRLNRLNLDQLAFAPAVARLFRVEPGAGEIPITLEPASRERPHFGDRLHWRRRFRREVDGDDVAFPHATILARSTAS